jgi:hypothetical protein
MLCPVMNRWSVSPVLGLVAAALVAGCGSSGGGSVDTSNLTQVQLSSSQALPPPYGQYQTTLTSAASLATFQQEMASNKIGESSGTANGGGCAGGIQYTIVLVRSGQSSTTLSAYDCGGQITGNMTGDVAGFIAYIATLLGPVSSGPG